jgi:cell division protein ZapA
MAQVEVTINGRDYRIACDDGQEDHLSSLAAYVDRRVSELVAAVGQVGESRLLVMVSLLIADELSETFSKLENGGTDAAGQAADALAQATEALAEKIETIAARFEAA